ncbi:carboxypeptidase regulatory-like domain-containing protein [Silvibacterium acidisoli]|uniref:carboxypeptidase regulatory-like domain-containing protein n=1 Tax=Acidobacteriaceae bacterium ZG23-2 TaxID=2883246 RepID=UPI00406D1238
MPQICRSYSVLCRICFAIILLLGFQATAYAQITSPSPAGIISGSVVDPSGALIPGADVQAKHFGVAVSSAATDDQGHYTISGLAPGNYTLEANAPGFRATVIDGVEISAGKVLHQAITLQIEVQQQETVVTDSGLDTSPEKNGGAIVIKGADLDALSNDPTELQDQLQAVAGANPDGGTQFYVDGFSGGKMPPKSSIREIRINQNPFSAQYDALGFGRIEIFTKPGTDKLHGELWVEGNDSALNTQNPFVANQPPYYSYMLDGDVNGPINKFTSFFAGVQNQHAINDSVVNAVVLDSNLNQTTFTQAVTSPTNMVTVNPRIDFQAGKVQTISLRYSLQRSTASNAGIGQFALASQAYNSDQTEQVLQFADTQMYGAHIVNETRFQYIRDRNNQNPVDFTPTITVQGGFTGGGNNTGINRDNQDHYEFQDYLQIEHGNHEFNLGARIRDVRDANVSTSNFNGNFTFASIGAYQATLQGLKNNLTWAQIRANGGGASLFSQTHGTPGIVVSVLDAGIYAEDTWKVRPNFTVSYGMRYETQTQISDHADFAPRFGASYSINGGKNKPPIAVFRGGYGLFYTRFASTNVLEAKRQNGIDQVGISVNSPNFYPGTCSSDPANCTGDTDSSPTIFSINPFLRAPYVSVGGFSMDKPIGKHVSISANYLYQRGVHLYLTRNINAPMPGTYNPDDPTSGTRPLGSNENIYQYESEGASSTNRFFLNARVQGKKMGVYAFYMLGKRDANTSGVTSFPSDQYDLHLDYGRAAEDIRNRAFLFGYFRLPGQFQISPFLMYNSSTPFNITVGQDLNGDTQFNDRPAFATDLTRASVYRTKWGNFDADPITGQKIIPINYGKGPNFFQANLRVTKLFSFGPKLPDENPPAPAPAAKAGAAKDAKAATPAKPVKKEIERKYNLGLSAGATNIFNMVNLAQPVGVLGSPLFGESTALASTFTGPSSANRTVRFDLFFRF